MRPITASISKGRPAAAHNDRTAYTSRNVPEHINEQLIENNVVLINESLEMVYEREFEEARVQYNQKQVSKGHSERQIDNYLEKVKADKQLKTCYEFVIQVGNKDDHLVDKEAVAIYQEFYNQFQKQYGKNLVVKQAVVHLDEATPHMHLELVPVAESKRGLARQNSLNKAIKQLGFEKYEDMLHSFDQTLEGIMRKHDLERVAGDREKQMGGVDINKFKENMRLKEEISNNHERLEQLRQEVEVKSTEASWSKSRKAIAGAKEAEKRNPELRADKSRLECEIRSLRSRVEQEQERLQVSQDCRKAAEQRSEQLADVLKDLERRGAEPAERIGRLREELAVMRERLRMAVEAIRSLLSNVGYEYGLEAVESLSKGLEANTVALIDTQKPLARNDNELER